MWTPFILKQCECLTVHSLVHLLKTVLLTFSIYVIIILYFYLPYRTIISGKACMSHYVGLVSVDHTCAIRKSLYAFLLGF